MNKAILQSISEIAEDYFYRNEDKCESDIYILIGEDERKLLEEDPLFNVFCAKYTDEVIDEFGLICEFTGIDIAVSDSKYGVEVIAKNLKKENENNG